MWRPFIAVVGVCLGIMLSGCPTDGGPNTLTVSPATLQLEVGQSAPLTPHSSATPDTFTWSSDRLDVATVSTQGRVTAVAVGTAQITLTSGRTDLTDTTTVTVVENLPPSITIGEPSAAATRQGPIDFPVNYTGAAEITLAAADITLNTTGTATATLGEPIITGDSARSIPVTDISGDGALSIAIAAGTATDTEGNAAPAAGPSTAVIVDNTAPTLEISAPSVNTTNTGPVDYLVNYNGADAITLTKADVLVNGTGTVAATLADVATTSETERTVSFSSIDGDGTLGISLAAATGADQAGNTTPAAGPSAEVVVDNTPPTVTIGTPSPSTTNNGPLVFCVTYDGASAITLAEADVQIVGSAGVVAVLDEIEATSDTVRTIRFSTVAGDGTLGIALAAGTATDTTGNLAPAAGPSATATVDNTAPTITIGAPSANTTHSGPIVFPVTYEGAKDVTLKAADVTLNRTGSANAQVTDITHAEGGRYDVTLGSVIGNGTVGISIAVGTATDDAGNAAPAAGPSDTFQVENNGPTLLIGPPSTANTYEDPLTYTVTYADATTIDLAPADITLNSEDGLTATITVTGDGATQRTVTLSSFSGSGEATISIAADTARDGAANPAPAAGPSAPIRVTPLLEPGSGFTGPTPQPDPIGDPGAPGIDAKAIARWDVVPYQTFEGYFSVGVVAFHINDIDRVEFSVDGGPWTAVREMTLNPDTNVVEYWIGLDARDFEDGPIEVRAVAYPKVGIPRVLEGPQQSDKSGKGETSLFLNTNANKTLPEIEMYISNSGNDDTGDGSESAPFLSIMKAARAIQDASPGGNADGGRIYLAAGEYKIGTYQNALRTSTAHRWLSVMPGPGVSKEDVRIIGSGTSDGLRTKLVRLQSLTIAPPTVGAQGILVSNGPLEDYYWVNDCEFIGPGRTADGRWSSGLSDYFVTSATVSSCRDGLRGSLVRDMAISNIGSDAITGTGMAIACTVQGLDASGTTFHADVLQFHGAGIENRIAYGVTAKSGDGQGFFAGDNISIKDIAFINCDISNQEDGGTVALAFQFMGPTEHLFVRDCIFTGRALWRGDAHFSAHNVVVENTLFTHEGLTISPGAVDGVTYR